MPFFENTTILCRDPHDFDNYSTLKIKIAFMSNLERPITATAAAWQPGLLDRWDLQGGGGGRRRQRAACKYQANISGNRQPIATELETVYIYLLHNNTE